MLESVLSVVRVGCFTRTEDELDNLCTCGDVIFLYGTAIDNNI
jgi:hypothetical protein